MTSSRSLILLLTFLLIVSKTTIKAQNHERDNWYFGVRAGLKFSSNSVTVLNDGKTAEVNATTVMSDDNGNLLFYSDGIRIWSRNHQVMENGSGIDGYDGNYAQQIVAVHYPGDPNRYFVFYISNTNYPTHLHRLKYSIVNMAVGDGIVEAKNVLLPTENILVKIAAVEKIGEQFWIITQGDRTGKYFSFRGTPSGVNATPVVTDVGVSTSNGYDYGDLRFSPNGELLAATNVFSNRLSIFKFDFATGRLNEPLFISVTQPTSIEFASDGKLFYLTNFSNCSSNTLYQGDISSYTESEIKNSFINLGSASNIGMLQRGPNNIIYVGRRNPSDCNVHPYIGTISLPNERGVGAQFNAQAIYLEDGSTFQGLPNFPTNTDADAGPGVCDYTSLPATVTVCNEPSFTFDLTGTMAQLVWEDGSISPLREVTMSGLYIVESTVGSCKEIDSTRITFINHDYTSLPATVTVCNEPSFTFDLTGTMAQLVWEDGSVSPLREVTKSGLYIVESTVGSCKEIDSTRITFINHDYTSLPATVTVCNEPSFTFDLTGTTAQLVWEDGSVSPLREVTMSGVYTVESTVGICKEIDSTRITFNRNTIGFDADTLATFHFPVLLKPVIQTQPAFFSITWQDNTHSTSYLANGEGVFFFTATLDGCVYQDTITVIQRELFVPNVITTNNDGKNDFFVLPFIKSDERWGVYIFNRYGVPIFSDENYRNTWRIDQSQVCFYRIINKEYGIEIKGVLHVIN